MNVETNTNLLLENKVIYEKWENFRNEFSKLVLHITLKLNMLRIIILLIVYNIMVCLYVPIVHITDLLMCNIKFVMF